MRSLRALTLLRTLTSVAALGAEGRAVAAANAAAAAHLEALRSRRRGPTATTAAGRESQICEQLGIPSLRPFQRSVLSHMGVLDDGGSGVRADFRTNRRDILAVQPTGAGKSVCFQAAGVVLPGTTLVVSPLIALMQDQVDQMSATGVRTATINSMQTAAERDATIRALSAGELDLLYLSPEQLDKNQRLYNALAALPTRPPLLAVDEAHCISQWGNDFRPSYRRLARLREALAIPRLVALTASAPPQVRDDVAQQLEMAAEGAGGLRLVASCRRPNIALSRADKSVQSLTEQLRRPDALPALVYAQTRATAELLGDQLAEALGGERVLCYHAGLTAAAREEAQHAFLAEEGLAPAVMVATNAFGMGIDKRDIRTVVHYGPPGSMEQLYQEVGRGGRDGKPTRAVLMASKGDRGMHMHRAFVEVMHPPVEAVARVWRTLLAEAAPRRADAPPSAFGAAAGAADLFLECSVKELQEATRLHGAKEGGTGPPVSAAARCVNVLAQWGFVERLSSRTALRVPDAAAAQLCVDAAAGPGPAEGRGEAEVADVADATSDADAEAAAAEAAAAALPAGVRKGTNQAAAWSFVARRIGGEMRRQAAAGGGGPGASEAALEVESDDFDDWARQAGFGNAADPQKARESFANALRALQTKGLLQMSRTAALQVRIPAAAARAPLPTSEADERVRELKASRAFHLAKLDEVVSYMSCRVTRDGDEDEALWRRILDYFGEEAEGAGAGAAGELGGSVPPPAPRDKQQGAAPAFPPRPRASSPGPASTLGENAIPF